MSILLSEAELVALTRYARPADQLAELHRQGFNRARRHTDGSIVLERAHYEAVCAGGGMKKKSPQTNAERQAALVERRKAAGLKQYRNLWGPPEDEAAVRAYVARKVRARK